MAPLSGLELLRLPPDVIDSIAGQKWVVLHFVLDTRPTLVAAEQEVVLLGVIAVDDILFKLLFFKVSCSLVLQTVVSLHILVTLYNPF